MGWNVVNFPSEYLVSLEADIWKTLLQGTSQIKINLSGCSMITKSFQKFGESSIKTVLWPWAIKLEFQPMWSLRLSILVSVSVCLSFCYLQRYCFFWIITLLEKSRDGKFQRQGICGDLMFHLSLVSLCFCNWSQTDKWVCVAPSPHPLAPNLCKLFLTLLFKLLPPIH